MPAKLYTVKAVEEGKNDTHAEDAREKIAADLAAHYEKTWSILLERRDSNRGRWVAMHVIDVLHPGETDVVEGLTANAEAVAEDARSRGRSDAIADLVDAIVQEAEGQASLEGPTRVRATGRPERPNARALWAVPWVAGGDLLPSEQKLHAADANVAALTSVSLQLDRSHRSIDRLLARVERMCDKAASYHDATMDSATKLIDTLAKVEGPSIAAATIKLQQQSERAAHERSMQEDSQNHQLLMQALGLIAKGLDADRRDRKEDRERARAKVVDTTASETPPPPSEAKRPDVPRCEQALELLAVFEDLSAAEQTGIRAALTAEEWSAIGNACDAADVAAFDAAFGVLDASVQERGEVNSAALKVEMTRILGIAKCMTLFAIWSGHENRCP